MNGIIEQQLIDDDALTDEVAKANRPLTSDECLLKLARYGKPSVRRLDNGFWRASIDMLVTGAGVNFSVASGLDMATPADALNQCAERVEESLKRLGVKP